MKIHRLLLSVFLLGALSLSQTNALPALDKNNVFTGSDAFNGFLSQAHAGEFDNKKYYQYFTQAIGDCDPRLLYGRLNGDFETSAHAACARVPSGAAQRQVDAIAGMVDQQSGVSSPAVGMFGGAVGNSPQARAWGSNFVAIEVPGFPTQNMEVLEADYDLFNATSVPTGISLTGAWSAQPSSGQGFQIAINTPAYHWPVGFAIASNSSIVGIQFQPPRAVQTFGIDFLTGATRQTDNSHAAVRFGPIGSSVNQESQGLSFFANARGSGEVMEKVRVLPNGALDIDAQGGGGTFSVGGGTPISTTNQTGTGNLVLDSSPNLLMPMLNGIRNGTGLQLFNTTTTCATAPSMGATCKTGAIPLPVGYANTNYRVQCTGMDPTNLPVVETVTKSKLTFTITLVALTPAAATYSSYDCIIGHN